MKTNSVSPSLELYCNSTPLSQGFFEGIRATRGGAGGPGAPRPAVGAGALAMDTMDDDDAAGGVSLLFAFEHVFCVATTKLTGMTLFWQKLLQRHLTHGESKVIDVLNRGGCMLC